VTKTVLVADDEPEVREMVGEYLAARGCQVLQAQNGLEALLHVKRSRPQAIVLDVMMPRLGGLDALIRIHRFDPSMTVVVVTAHADDALKARALALGAVAVLAKPFELADLGRALGVDAGTSATAALPRPDARATAPAPARTRGTVLIVDDDDSVRELLVELLSAQGYSTHVAENGTAGVRAITELAIDVVLLDIDMPGISGVNALVAIRAVAPHVAVIMVSGIADVAVARQALASGAFDYVTKPIDVRHLRDAVEAAIEMKRLDAS
jgi:CheY-like chemotaxis protein